MSDFVYEVRLCLSCGLRYPVEKNHPYSIRCPQCLGETKVISEKIIHEEEKTRVKIEKRERVVHAVLLDNIRSAWNVGSVLRSADGFGFTHAYLCGITPTPENEAVRKTSLGAEESLSWSYHKDAVELVQTLKAERWKVWALEEDKRAIDLSIVNRNQRIEGSTQKSVLIVGSEVTGIDIDLLSQCDKIFYIPMQGEKRSLNVAIAFSVAAFVLGQNSD